MTLISQVQEQSNWITQYQALFASFGFGGLMLFLFITDRIKTKTNYDELKPDRDMWRDRSDKESELRRSAEERADLALEQAKVTVHLLESLDAKAAKKSPR